MDSLRVDANMPDAPPQLQGESLNHWNYLEKYLGGIGVLTRVDLGAMHAACVAYAQALEADAHVAAHGLVICNDKGNLHKNPAVEIAHQAWLRYFRFAVEFGLTPASRAKIPQPQRPESDELEAFTKQA